MRETKLIIINYKSNVGTWYLINKGQNYGGKMISEYLLNNMTKDEMRIVEEKYEVAINQTLSSFAAFQNANPESKVLSISYKWNELIHCFNAECTRVRDDSYLITYNLYIIVKLEQTFRCRNISETYIYQIISAIITFITWHEIMHVVFGHCTISKIDMAKIPNKIKRNFEMMCDLKAANNMLVDIYISREKLSHEEQIFMYASLYCSLFIYFKILEDINLKDMESAKEHDRDFQNKNKKYQTVTSDLRTHPFITIRFDSICIAIECELKRQGYSVNNIDKIYKESLMFSEIFGFYDGFAVNPFYRRNKKSQLNDMSIDFESMKKYINKCYIKI